MAQPSGDPSPSASVDLDSIRACFPALGGTTAFLENAGGSQLPTSVIEAIDHHLRYAYVQLGAGYAESVAATNAVDEAHRWMERFVNAGGSGRVILGASTSALLRMIAECWRARIRAGDEIVMADAGHESNISPWLMLEECGARIRWWPGGDDPAGCPLDALDSLLNERTRLVCFHHVSNLLGAVVDVREVVRRARAVGARTVVDGVAFAPHRLIDAAALGCDWYVFSNYKVYGPHIATLFGRHEAIAELGGPGHFFVPRDRVPGKFELGGVSHEACAGLLGLRPYLALLAGKAGRGAERAAEQGEGRAADRAADHDAHRAADPDPDRAAIERAFDLIERLEAPLTQRLLNGLASIDGLRVIGSPTSGPDRVPTVSVVHSRLSSGDIVRAVHARRVAIRHGHMYSHRLCQSLGFEPEDGVVRVSAVHYNSAAEIDRVVDAVAGAVRLGA